MIKSRPILFVVSLLFMLGLGVAVFFLKQKNPVPAGPLSPKMIGSPVPDIMLKDQEGQEVFLSDFRGKPLVIYLWATWCPLCKDELRNVMVLHKEFSGHDEAEVVFFAINRGESPELVAQVARELRIDATSTLMMLRDRDDELYRRIKGFAMPETLFIDRNGLIRGHTRGSVTPEELRRRIRDLLSVQEAVPN